MDAVEQANLRIVDLKSAIKFKNSEARKLQEELSAERVSDFKDERKMRSLQTKINQLKDEVTKRLPDLLKDAKEQLKLAIAAKKEAEILAPKQEAIIPDWIKKSKDLYTILKQAKKENDELHLMRSAYHGMEKKTGIQMDLKGVSIGFSSIDALVDTIEGEIKGEGRRFFTYPAGFRV